MKNKYTDDFKKQISIAWGNSELSLLKYSKQNNISESALRRWLKEYYNAESANNFKNPVKNPKVAEMGFLKLKSNSVSSPTLADSRIEIKLPNGVVINISVSNAEVKNLVKELLLWR